MPYIRQDARESVNKHIDNLLKVITMFSDSQKSGVMNYTITSLINHVYRMDNPSYKEINDAMGMLECVKQELYRRKAAPYEDIKINENGDI
jgi:hypothetical protein